MRGSHPFFSGEMALVKDLRHAILIRLRGSEIWTKVPKSAISDCFWATIGYNKIRETQFLSVQKLLARPVPASASEGGKRFAKYLETKEAAEHFVAEHRKTGSIQ